MGNVLKQIFFDQYQDLDKKIILSSAEGGKFVVLGFQNTSTLNMISQFRFDPQNHKINIWV